MNTLLAINNFASVVLTATATDSNPLYLGRKVIIAVVVGLLIGLLYALSLKSQLTSVFKKDSAADYTRDKSFNVETKKDMFLFSKTVKTQKQQPVSQQKPAK